MRAATGPLTDPTADPVLSAAIALITALRAEMAASARPPEPERLLSLDEAARLLGIGRTALYRELDTGRLRSVKVGRRRLIPSSAVAELTSPEAGR
jgi:excisionase family DNA binding protein